MRYVFTDCELDTERYSLYRADHRIPLRPTAFQLLTYLVEHRDRMVSKRELCEQVWQAHIVSDATLENCVKTVRQAVGDSGRTQQIIRTWYGHGYRFVAPVEVRGSSQWDTGTSAPPAEAPTQPEQYDVTTATLPGGGQALPQRSPAALAPTSHGALAPFGTVPDTSGNDLGERKIVTVLCCAFVQPSVRGKTLSHEMLSPQLHTLYHLVSRDVHRYGGTVYSLNRACLLAVFGAPVAQEDHAQRAVLAALSLRQRLSAEGSHPFLPDKTPLVVRSGVHTGAIAVKRGGPIQGATVATLGETATMAITLQEQAAPGTILCSAVTAALVRRIVRLNVVGASLVTGQSSLGPFYQVEKYGTRRAAMVLRSQWMGRPFVGRTRELAMLHALWAHVTTGHGHVVSVVGGPGMGKSRLVDTFRRGLAGQPHTYLRGRCVSYGQIIPYLPVLDLVRHACGMRAADRPSTITAKVSRLLQELEIEPATQTPYLAHLLGGQVEPEWFAELPPEVIKARTLAVLYQMCINGSRRHPLVLEVEDLHWSDAASEAMLAALVDQCVGLPLFLLVTIRPGYRAPWMDKSYATQIALTRLSPTESQQVVQACLPGTHIPEVLMQQVVTKAAGNPFFLEELARTIDEQGAQQVPLAVPDTIQAVLAARLDRLPSVAKRVLQAAAVIGSEIPLSLLAAITAMPTAELSQCLAHLQSAEFLQVTHLVPEPVYTFIHILTQDATLQTLFPQTLGHYHQQIAHVLTTQYPDTAAQQPALVAHHYTEAGDSEHAVVWWQRAGQWALEHSVHGEAMHHCATGLKLLSTLPDVPERLQLELELTITLGHALRLSRGNAAPEVGRTFARAWQLCQQVGEPRHRFSVLGGWRRHYMNRGEHQTARQCGEQLLHLAQRAQDAFLLQDAHYSLGITLSFLGAAPAALVHLERGMVLVDHQQPRSVHWGLLCRILAALNLWTVGYPDQALMHAHEAVAGAQALSRPVTLLEVLFFAARLHQCCREAQIVQAQAEETIALATEWGLPQWLTSARMLRGWALAEQEQAEEGIAQIQEGITAHRAIGVKPPTGLVLLAAAYGKVGQPQKGLRAVAEGLEVVANNGEHWYEAELYRLHGELLLQQERTLLTQTGVRQRAQGNKVKQAEASLLRALAIARRQQAKSWELRAAMSLCRLWQQQGKRDAARQLLTPIYDWFTEGFNTADVQEAKGLLEELNG